MKIFPIRDLLAIATRPTSLIKSSSIISLPLGLGKLLKKATCVSNFFNPSRSFQHEAYQALKTFIATYGKEPLYRYIDRRFLWFCQYKFIYRIYSWCYRKAKGLKKGKKKTIK